MNDLPEIWPENNWREVWHAPCPESDRTAPMKHLPDELTIEDGSVLRGYECVACGAKVFAGLDAKRFVVRRRFVVAKLHLDPKEPTP